MRSTFLSALLLMVSVPSLFGQVAPPVGGNLATDPTQQDRPRLGSGSDSDESARQGSTIPALYPDELDDVGPLFLLVEQKMRELVRFFADMQVYYTTNAGLSEKNETSANVSVATTQVELWPLETAIFGGTANVRLGVRYQWYRYGLLGGSNDLLASGLRLEDLDFDSLTGFGELRWQSGPWFVATGLDLSRVMAPGFGDKIYAEAVPYGRLGYRYSINERSEIYGEYDGRYRLTQSVNGFDEGINDRHEHALNLVYGYLLTPRLIGQISYRLQYSGFTNGSNLGGNEDRDDLTNSAAVAVVYVLTDFASVRVFSSVVRRDSDADGFTFQAANFGGGLNLNVAF